MMMTPNLRRFALTSHITFSVGWLGSVVVFIVLASTALTSLDIPISRSALIAMEVSALYVILPFCLASFLTGVIQATCTRWSLFKHYWIIVKLGLTIVSTILLLLHLQPINHLAEVAIQPKFINTNYSSQIINIISKSGAAILALVGITTISVYKPWGTISLRNKNNNLDKKKKAPSFYILIGLVLLLAILIIKHLIDGGMQEH